MHNITSRPGVAAATSRSFVPGAGTKRRSALLLAGLLIASALPGFAQKYVTQYTGVTGPTGAALDTVGGKTYLYVADESRGDIVKYDVATGTVVATFGAGSQSDQLGQFGRPYGVAVDPVSHDLYVAERLNGRIQRINSTTGAPIMAWGVNDASFNSSGANVNPPNPSSPQGHFQEPIGIAADANGDVYVVDHGNDRVQKFLVHQVNGAWTADNVAMWGSQGSGNGQFDHPYGAALDSAGNLWVADGLNGRVEKFDPNGNFLGSVGTKGTAAGQFVITTWVSFDASGALWVTSTNSDPQATTASDINSQWVSKFAPSGSTATFVSRFGGTYGSNAGEFRLPFDAVVDAANQAYVSDYYNSRIQVFDLGSTATSGGSGGTTSGGSTSGSGSTTGTSTGSTSGGSTSGTGSTGGTGSTSGTGTGSSSGTGSTGGSTGSTGGNGGVSASAIAAAAGPADGTYRAGQALVFTLTFSAPVTLQPVPARGDDRAQPEDSGDTDHGTPDSGRKGDDGKGRSHDQGGHPGGDRGDSPDGGVAAVSWSAVSAPDSGQAMYVSGSGTTTLTFKYQVHGNDSAPNGITLGTTIHLAAGMEIADASGHALAADALVIPWPANPVTGVILVPAKLSNPGAEGSDRDSDGATSSPSGAAPAGNGSSATIPVAGNTTTTASGAGAVKTGGTPTSVGVTANGGESRLVNLSSRLEVSNDPSRAIAIGFVVSGTSPETVLVRAVGPGLRGFGVKDAIAAPKLQIQDSSGKIVATNSGWDDDPAVSHAAARVGAFKLAAGSRDAALVATLVPGAYTATVSSATGSGTALVEVYDASTGTAVVAPQLVNISTRGYVAPRGNLIVGFVVAGDSPKRVLVRAVGPGLTAFGVSGVLDDPQLQVDDSAGTAIAVNNDWGTPETAAGGATAATAADITAADAATGAFPLTAGSKDAAVVLTLNPGAYTAIVTGADASGGSALVEVYQLPSTP